MFALVNDSDRNKQINAGNALLLIVSVLLLGYLLYALLKAEKF